ncbi:MAG: hypothetical protein RR900_07570 [Ruthenibacterium sp.]
MGKTNIRSFRYSDQIARLLETMPGDSLNAKFEELVLSSYRMLPDILTRKEELTKDVCELRDKRDALQHQIFALEAINRAQKMLEKQYVDTVAQFADLQKQISDAGLWPML